MSLNAFNRVPFKNTYQKILSLEPNWFFYANHTLQIVHYFYLNRALTERVDISQELREAGNVTIFSPPNEVFENLPFNIENFSLPLQRRLILRHFVRGFLFRRDMENGPVSTGILHNIFLRKYVCPSKKAVK